MSGSTSTGTNYMQLAVTVTASLSTCFWVKVNAFDKAAYSRVCSIADTGALVLDIGVQQDSDGAGTDDVMQLYANDSGGIDFSTNFISAASTWYFVAIVVQSGTVHLYFGTEAGGTLTHESFGIAANPNTLDAITLGAESSGGELGNCSFRGWRTWTDAALSQAELESEWYSGTFAAVRSSSLTSDIRIPNGTNPGTATTGTNATVTGTWSADASDPTVPSSAGPGNPTLSPADGATGVAIKGLHTLTFAENVQAVTGNVTLVDDTTGETLEVIPIGDTTRITFSSQTVTINPLTTLVYGRSYHWLVDNGAIESTVDNEDWTGISSATAWNFTTINAIDFVASGATVFSTGGGTTVAPTWPTTAAGLGGIDLLFVGTKPTTSGAGQVAVPDSAGFRWLATLNAAGGYGGSSAADTGDSDLHVYWRQSSDAVTGSITVTVAVGATNGVAAAKIMRFKTNVGGNVRPLCATGSQTAAGNLSVEFATNPAAWRTRVGDMIAAVFIAPTDIQTGANYSAQALTQTGVTFGTVTEQQEWNSTNGFDCGGFAAYAPVLVGAGLGKPTLSATAVTTTNVRGPAAFVRLRAIQ